MSLIINKPDVLGAITSVICLVHCLFAPLLYLVPALVDGQYKLLEWLDFVFLTISLLAIYRSSQTASKRWLVSAFWGSWILLMVVIVNEKIGWLVLPELSILVPGGALIILHIINLKLIKQKVEECCSITRD